MSVDYIVTAKRDYEGELTHLKVREIKSDEALAAEARSKEDVVTDILVNDKTVYTATANEDEFVLEKKIRVVKTGGEYFLRVDDESVREDSLRALPKF